MTIQPIIMNHHSRNASPIVDAIDLQGYEPALFTDPTDFASQRGNPLRYLGIARNYLNILTYETDADWKVIMHDDISIPDGVLDKIDYVLDRAPQEIVSFYNPTNKAYLDAYKKGHHTLSTHKNVWLQVHAIPTALSYEIANWIREKADPFGLRAEDGTIWSWSTITRRPLYAIIPSLFQHEGYAKSTFGNPAKAGRYFRYSETYRPNFDVTEVDWEAEFNNPYRHMVTESNLEGWKK